MLLPGGGGGGGGGARAARPGGGAGGRAGAEHVWHPPEPASLPSFDGMWTSTAAVT